MSIGLTILSFRSSEQCCLGYLWNKSLKQCESMLLHCKFLCILHMIHAKMYKSVTEFDDIILILLTL